MFCFYFLLYLMKRKIRQNDNEKKEKGKENGSETGNKCYMQDLHYQHFAPCMPLISQIYNTRINVDIAVIHYLLSLLSKISDLCKTLNIILFTFEITKLWSIEKKIFDFCDTTVSDTYDGVAFCIICF